MDTFVNNIVKLNCWGSNGISIGLSKLSTGKTVLCTSEHFISQTLKKQYL